MYVFDNESLQYFIRKIKEKLASKSELDSKVDKVPGKDLTDVDFTDGAISALEKKYDILDSKQTTDYTHMEFQSSDLQTKKEFDLKHGCDIYIYPIFEMVDGYVFKALGDDVEIPYEYISKDDYTGTVVLTITSEAENINIRKTYDLSTLGEKGIFLISGLTLDKDYNLTLTVESDDNSFKSNFFEKTISVREYTYIFEYPYGEDINLFPNYLSYVKTINRYHGDGLVRAYSYVFNPYNSWATSTVNFANYNFTGLKKVPSTATSFNGFLTNCNRLQSGLDYEHPSVTTMQNMCQNCTNLEKTIPVGNTVLTMANAYKMCYNLLGPAVCGNYVTNMSQTYYDCNSLEGDAACGPNVTNMYFTYWNCQSLTGSPACGPNVVDMSYSYANCIRLSGAPACGNFVQYMNNTYDNCCNLTGTPVCGDGVINFYAAYANCSNLTGSAPCGNNVSNMAYTYRNCFNLTGPAIINNTVNNTYYTFESCHNLRNVYIMSNKLVNVVGMFNGRFVDTPLNIYVNKYNSTMWSKITNTSDNYSITGKAVTYTNAVVNSSRNEYRLYNTMYNINIYTVDNVSKTYKLNELGIVLYKTTDTNLRPKEIKTLTDGYDVELNGDEVLLCKNNPSDIITYINMYDSANLTSVNLSSSIGTLTNMSNTFYNCYNLTSAPVCGPNVTDMSYAYCYCTNLTGSPVCGPNVTNMKGTYYDCRNLTGSPVCGDKVTDMFGAYYNCRNLTGTPVCGDNVTSLYFTYTDCINLTGGAVCGNNVQSMSQAYQGCTNLTGPSIVGPNVLSLYYAFQGCTNLQGNLYVFSNKVFSDGVWRCFDSRNTSNKLNIYIPINGYNATANSLNSFLTTSNTNSIVGENISWLYDASKKYYYNTSYNIYIHPKEEDMLKVYKDNEYLVARYKFQDGRNVMPTLTNITCYSEDEIDSDGFIIRSLYCNNGFNYSYGIKFTNDSNLLEVHNLRLDYVNTGYEMFRNCENLTYVNMANLVTNNITNMDYMFTGTGIYENSFVNVEWNTNNLTTAKYMFWNCKNLNL